MVGYVIHDDFQTTLMSLRHERIERCQVAEERVYIRIVSDVVAEVDHRRGVNGRKPDGIYPEPGKIVKFGNDAGEVADSIGVGVFEAAWVHLVNNPLLPPEGLLGLNVVCHTNSDNELLQNKRLPRFLSRAYQLHL